MKKSSIKYIVLLFLNILAFVVFFNIVKYKKNVEVVEKLEVELRHPTEDRELVFESKNFNEVKLKEQIKLLNIQHPDIVFAQAVLESGSFKSRLFVNHNNLFGMTIANSRPTLNTGSGPFSKYKNWKHSVIDYALFQSVYMHNLSKEDYFKALGKTYAEDPHYVRKLKEIINKI